MPELEILGPEDHDRADTAFGSRVMNLQVRAFWSLPVAATGSELTEQFVLVQVTVDSAHWQPEISAVIASIDSEQTGHDSYRTRY